MGKLLRVLVIIMFPLAAGALALGIMLFAKRDLIAKRTRLLEDTMIELSSFVEKEDAPVIDIVHPKKDISDVSDREIMNPETSPFWSQYEDKYERGVLPYDADENPNGIPTLDWNSNRRSIEEQLSGFYERDKEGKVVITARGKSEKGTMKALLDELTGRISSQLTTLRSTRQQLVYVREELERTIEDLNTEKQNHRRSKVKITQLENTVARLEAEKRDLERQVAALEQEKRALNEEIAELNRTIGALQDEKLQMQQKINTLTDDLKRALNADRMPGSATGNIRDFGVGPKGTIVSVVPQFNFVVVELNAEFMETVKQQSAEGEAPTVDLYVRHKGATEDKVTNRIRIDRYALEDSLGIGTVLLDWQQDAVQVGDIVFF